MDEACARTGLVHEQLLQLGVEYHSRVRRRPPRPMSDAERAKYLAWWLERSGLSLAELHEIAVGLALPD